MKYELSQKGIEDLEQLKNDINVALINILDASEELLNYMRGLEDGLGPYYDSIIEQVHIIQNTVKDAWDGDDGIQDLTTKYIPDLINKIQMYILFTSGNGEDTESAKVYLKRR